jgi:hypothetical protein
MNDMQMDTSVSYEVTGYTYVTNSTGKTAMGTYEFGKIS